MNLDQKEKYKLEYAEVGHLRRHYSTVRSGLTTFSMTASLAAFASYFSQAVGPGYWRSSDFSCWLLLLWLVLCFHIAARRRIFMRQFSGAGSMRKTKMDLQVFTSTDPRAALWFARCAAMK